ncbi:tetratricopeptide repeat protein [Trichlorobacter ammonificans]|uniref:TPR repeat-containing protein n=1 Tax=Trichlorobacter ammonificans TaxID=2916410 RepID=A0ABM9DCK0_9BACT|nr:tetratricopeptide repeat protein [Trichlorobacter ammonificans]CAH2032608.1 TPR repeat-containing protein [Trichlorobacter ammonificans]
MESQSLVDKMFSALSSQQNIRESVATSAVSSGLSLMEKKKYKEAAAAFRQATALKPDYVDAYNMMAQAYQKLGQNKDATRAYVISLKLDNTQSEVHVNLANLYIDQKQYTEAQASLKAATRADPTNALPHYTLGLLLQQLEKPAEAEAEFRQAVRLAPTDGNAYYGLATALSSQERYSEAVPLLQKAMQLKKNFAPAMVELGRIYAKQGEEAKAQEVITSLKALDTDQGDVFAADLEELLRKPRLLAVIGEQSTLKYKTSTMPLLAIDPSVYIKPGASKEFSMTFQFSTDMDTKSVTNITNWKIGRSSGGTGGLYDNGLYRSSDRAAFIMPSRVTYNPVDRQATVYFPITQNEDLSGTIDFSRLTFKFKGVDQTGKSMDTTADEFNGWANKPF